MPRSKLIALSLAGALLPVAIAFSAWLLSNTTLADTTSVPPLAPSERIWTENGPSASPTTEADDHQNEGPGTPTPSPSPGQSTGPGHTPTDDHGGRCSEPEHVNDPECQGGGSGGSGSSGGGDDSPNSGSSGSGKGGSGSGGDD